MDLLPPRLFAMQDDSSNLPNASDRPNAISDKRSTIPDRPNVISVVGENVRRLRERAGLSLRELASRAGVSASTLSGLESGTGNPSVETLVDISGALGVPFSELVQPSEPDVQVQRADEGVVVEAAGAAFSSRLLLAVSGRSMTEVYEATMEPGDDVYRAEPHLSGVAETVIVTQGRMRVGPSEAAVELGPGDRATFSADRPHIYEALAPATRAILVLAYR
jgi:transcriptional regulator with XRE-family HTH domain